MIGIASRNEKRAADSRSMPIHRAAVMVMPDRETPGCSAKPWTMPSPSPVLTPMESMPRSLGERASTHHSTTPKTASMTAISHGSPRCSWIGPSKTAPSTAPGIVPSTSAHASRWSVVEIDRERIEWTHATRYRQRSRRKYATAPTSVPTCNATSNVLFSATSFTMSQLKSHGTRIRWPELEMGANSVTPCVRPRMIACRTVKREVLSGGRSAPC